jgi:hypothetical protein
MYYSLAKLNKGSTFIMPREGGMKMLRPKGAQKYQFSGINLRGGSESSRYTEGGGSKLFKVLV